MTSGTWALGFGAKPGVAHPVTISAIRNLAARFMTQVLHIEPLALLHAGHPTLHCRIAASILACQVLIKASLESESPPTQNNSISD